ncbi:gluconate:H+ symporter [Stenotrophomonas sp. 24(2023)]|uniref:GntP family permease n=1 Tax=Stenotrophomonas sp. 24(2023) TaxID=3068324 RepID=UPI0027E12E2F|nr:gluconate:H+ symporter [Stenotrophomonas sp. 24(2023)]WMJ68640.1 gluconate:H+ symporter [Stenotrophomonas sp. 24(2023)]
MTPHDTFLLVTALASVLFLVFLIVSRLHVHPLLALLVTSIGVGLVTGMPGAALLGSITAGAGKTLGAIGLVVALGAMLGKILASTGVTEGVADIVLRRTSERALPWAMAGLAFVIGIPMFFEVGMVVLLPLIFAVAKRLQQTSTRPGSAYVYAGVPVIAALAAMHGMVPPHPGPLTAIATLQTSVGPTLVYGFIAAVPAIVLAGPVYASFIARRLQVRPDAALIEQFTPTRHADDAPAARPGLALGIFASLLPALLMLSHALGELVVPASSALAPLLAFFGHPIMAMLVGVLFAMATLARHRDRAHLRDELSASLKPIAGVLLIIAGGGAFQQVLTDAKVGDAIVSLSHQFALSPLLLGWVISMLLSVSTGSATVGIVGAAGLLAPLAARGADINAPLLALSIGCGSLFFNYANHAGFWLVKESFGMSMSEATWTNAITQSIVSLVGLGMVLLMNLFPALG